MKIRLRRFKVPSLTEENESEKHLGIVTFEKLSIDRHHTPFAFDDEDSICTIWVDFVDDVSSFPLGFELSLRFMGQDPRSSDCKD